MSKEMKEGLISQGVDYNTALERFMGKDDLYERFLVKFLDDEDARIVEILRSGSLDGVEELYEILREKYQKLCDTIKKCE